MPKMRPDPTFYPSPKLAMDAPTESLAYVALLASGDNGKRDALGVIDVDKSSSSFGQLVGKTEFPNGGNELLRLLITKEPQHFLRRTLLIAQINARPRRDARAGRPPR